MSSMDWVTWVSVKSGLYAISSGFVLLGSTLRRICRLGDWVSVRLFKAFLVVMVVDEKRLELAFNINLRRSERTWECMALRGGNGSREHRSAGARTQRSSLEMKPVRLEKEVLGGDRRT
uniref:Uncharacterized protein n=1 Tax=Fagus sylvatica TaxID=28930 RepID=A0A2N9H1S0_FAGSY